MNPNQNQCSADLAREQAEVVSKGLEVLMGLLERNEKDHGGSGVSQIVADLFDMTCYLTTVIADFKCADPESFCEYCAPVGFGEDGEIHCTCGNSPNQDGFDHCAANGARMEPNIGSGWDGHYICNRCGKVWKQEG